MSKKPMRLTFPQHLIKEPVIYRMAKEYEVIPNIRRAKVTETVGEVILELEGEEDNLKEAIDYLTRVGVKVEPVEGDVIA